MLQLPTTEICVPQIAICFFNSPIPPTLSILPSMCCRFFSGMHCPLKSLCLQAVLRYSRRYVKFLGIFWRHRHKLRPRLCIIYLCIVTHIYVIFICVAINVIYVAVNSCLLFRLNVCLSLMLKMQFLCY